MNTIKKQLLFSNHAVKQMFQRSISLEEVTFVLENGEIITDYPEDRPYPSKLLFAIKEIRPLHVVCSINESENTIIIITAYEPSTDIWENDFVTRKK